MSLSVDNNTVVKKFEKKIDFTAVDTNPAVAIHQN